MTMVDGFVEWAHNGLLGSEKAQEYLLGRGVSEDQWVRHRLGYVVGDYSVDPSLDPGHNEACGDRDRRGLWCDSCRYAHWSALWVKDDDEPEGASKRPIMGRRITGGVVFPLTNYAGGTVGFQVRSITEKSYDTFTLRHRPEGYFFGIAQSIQSIWTSREAWIVEGGFDHLVLERLVAKNVIGLTTSAPGKEQTRFLRRFVDVVNSCLDRDAGGRKGFRSIVKWNSGHFGIRDIEYPRVRPNDKDLGDFWKAVGDEIFTKYFREKVISRF